MPPLSAQVRGGVNSMSRRYRIAPRAALLPKRRPDDAELNAPCNRGARRADHSGLVREMAILVAEDNPVSRLLACEFLISCGHRVSSAHNGEQALRLARSGRFEMMLLDLHMPVLDGLEVIRAIRAETAYDGLQVIAVTGDARPGQREELLAAGVDGFMTKPLDLSRLAAEIERLVVARQASRQGKF